MPCRLNNAILCPKGLIMKKVTREILIHAHSKCRSMPVYSDPNFPPSLYYRFFEVVASVVEPEISVELGTCGGGAALHLAKGWSAGRVTSFDITKEPTVQIVESTFSNFRFVQEDVVAGASMFEPGSVSILFIDTTHTYEQTVKEYTAWGSKIAHGGVIFFDDLGREGMWPALREIGGDQVHFSDLGGDGGMVALLIS